MRIGCFAVLPFALADERQDRVRQASAVLQTQYDEQSGYWNGNGFWNSGNSLEALSNAAIYSQDATYLHVLQNTFERYDYENQLKNNKFMDDLQWWGLAWTRAFEATGNADFLAHSRGLHARAAEFWDDFCDGGVWWSTDKGYKNAITNELFLSLSTRLYTITGEQAFLDWAEKSYTWFLGSGMINGDSLINDGLDGNCNNNGGEPWSYNQGVLFGGLLELYSVKQDSAYLDLACRVADAVLDKKLSEGILHESCDPGSCGADGEQFKGVFVRYLGYLTNALPETYSAQRQRYASFLDKNAENVWSCARSSDGKVRESWECIDSPATTTTHTSGLDLLNADLLLNGAKASFVKVGFGNCAPNRPQWYGEKSFQQCESACANSASCIGFDWDTSGFQQCRVRFPSNGEASSPPDGFSFQSGEEGSSIDSSGGAGSAVCFRRAVQYSMVGSGNCAPNRPQWFAAPATYGACRAACDQSTCIGFDWDNSGFQYCRVRFARNADLSDPPAGFQASQGEEGQGFDGAGGSSSTTCYAKASTTTAGQVVV